MDDFGQASNVTSKDSLEAAKELLNNQDLRTMSPDIPPRGYDPDPRYDASVNTYRVAENIRDKSTDIGGGLKSTDKISEYLEPIEPLRGIERLQAGGDQLETQFKDLATLSPDTYPVSVKPDKGLDAAMDADYFQPPGVDQYEDIYRTLEEKAKDTTMRTAMDQGFQSAEGGTEILGTLGDIAKIPSQE